MPPKVLLVDDEARVTQALRRALRQEDYDVMTAASANEALAVLAGEKVDVIVSDEQMPGMSGSELLGVVRREYPETMRIILTGHASLEAAIRSINAAQIFRFLVKPCKGADLAATIRKALQQKKLLAQSFRLLKILQRQSVVLEQLEQEHPGISQVERDEEGVIILDEYNEDLEELLGQMDREVNRAEGRFRRAS